MSLFRSLARTAGPRLLSAPQPVAASLLRRWYSTPESGGNAYFEKIEKVVKNNPLVVFMKGVPSAPQCGFSNAVVQILDLHGVSNYEAFNVLEDVALREAIKQYSNWPTIPQVYIKGEFVGGCDIMINLHKTGELQTLLKDAGIESTYKPDDDEE